MTEAETSKAASPGAKLELCALGMAEGLDRERIETMGREIPGALVMG